MELNLSPDLEGKLARAADRRGVSADVLIREAIERAVDYDDWFTAKSRRASPRSTPGRFWRTTPSAPAWSRSWRISPVVDGTPVGP